MSRRLDALFAERVLGLSGPWCRGCEALYSAAPIRNGEMSCEACGGSALRGYSEDLTAAWGGVEKLELDVVRFFQHEPYGPEDWECGVSGTPFDGSGSPAVALVQVCLRSAGVSEEEISGALEK